MKFSKLFTPIALLCISLLTITSCDIGGTDSAGPKEVAVTMKIQDASQPRMKQDHGATIASVDTLSEIKFLVEELELESSLDEDTLDFEAEDLIVNLPMDGSEFILTSKMVPEGIYEEFELEIEHDDNQEVNDPDFQDDNGRHSVVVQGTYNGEPFTYRSEQNFEMELELNPPLEIAENSSSFTIAINIDPGNWFVDPESGESLDPNKPANQSTIENNIKTSFNAECDEDDNEDDNDDDSDDN